MAQWQHLGAAVDSPTPTISAVTQLASVVNNLDYASEGLTLARMGLVDMSAEEIRAYARGGEVTS